MTRRPRPLRDTWSLLRDPLGFYRRLQAEHGDWAPLGIGPRRAVLISDPATAAEVLQRDVDEFHKGLGNEALLALMEHSVFLAEGDDWKRQRPPVMAALRRGVLAPRLPIVAERVTKMVAGWHDGDRIELTPTIRRSSTAIAAEALMGADSVHESLLDDLDAVWREMCRRIGRPLADRVPGPRRRAYEAARGRVREAVAAIVAAHRARPDASPLSSVLGADDLRDDEAFAEAMTLLATGQECVAIATTWALVLLAQHPEAAEKVCDEVVGLTECSADALTGLPYTRAVVDEAMRLYPPAWMLTREADTPLEVGGSPLPPRTVAMICPHVMHRDPGRWSDPDRFDPDRFLAGGEGRTTARRSYIPFGSGPRTCAGITWARWQAVATVALISQHASLELEPDADPRPARRPGLTLRPADRLPVRVRLR